MLLEVIVVWMREGILTVERYIVSSLLRKG
jgi:hypothetical protein